MQPGYDESMKKVSKKDYKEVQQELSKLDNGMKSLLTEEQKLKYSIKP